MPSTTSTRSKRRRLIDDFSQTEKSPHIAISIDMLDTGIDVPEVVTLVFSATEIRFIQLIVEELTANGVVPASRLYESPFTDHAPTGPDMLFPGAAGDRIFVILDEVRDRARPEVGVA